MIYTVTLNPSLDDIVSVDDFRLGVTNRACAELMLPGGKGINVSIVLGNLGIRSTALGFIAGFTGDEIARRVERMHVRADFIRLEAGISRINFKLRSVDGTEINGMGPAIDEKALALLMEKLDDLCAGDILVLAGSIPPSLPDDIYSRIMDRLADRDIRVVVDATGKLLRDTLSRRPFLIKPNNHELGALFGVELSGRDEVVSYAKELQDRGARNVLVSMGAAGAVLVAENGQVYTSPAPAGRLVNSVGAGDSMVAGFLAGWLERKDYAHAFYMGLAAGSASAFSEYLATGAEVENVYRSLKKCGE